jgi:hypothetical protein
VKKTVHAKAKAKTKTVSKNARHPSHAKPKKAKETVGQELAKLTAEIGTLKHDVDALRDKTEKSVKHPSTKHSTKRSWSPGYDVACCSAEALAASLRLQGVSVAHRDVLDLFWRAGGDEDEGASILAALGAASESGLGGHRLVSYHPHAGDAAGPVALDVFGVDDLDAAALAIEAYALPPVQREAVLHRPVCQAFDGHALILGLQLPEATHTVLATPGGWWSWGELYCPWCEFPDAVVEEAWAVTWEVAEQPDFMPDFIPPQVMAGAA